MLHCTTPTVHSRAQTRDHRKAPAFCPFPLATFPPAPALHGYAAHDLPDLPWPHHASPSPQVRGRRSSKAPDRAEPSRTPRATRARRHGEGEIPRGQARASRQQRTSARVAPPPRRRLACPAFDGWGGTAEEGEDARARTSETGQEQPAMHGRPAAFTLPSLPLSTLLRPSPIFSSHSFGAPASFAACVVSLCVTLNKAY